MAAACLKCGAASSVIDSRPRAHGIRRRRICPSCNERWTTYEVPFDPRELAGLRGQIDSNVAALSAAIANLRAVRRFIDGFAEGLDDKNVPAEPQVAVIPVLGTVS